MSVCPFLCLSACLTLCLFVFLCVSLPVVFSVCPLQFRSLHRHMLSLLAYFCTRDALVVLAATHGTYRTAQEVLSERKTASVAMSGSGRTWLPKNAFSSYKLLIVFGRPVTRTTIVGLDGVNIAIGKEADKIFFCQKRWKKMIADLSSAIFE